MVSICTLGLYSHSWLGPWESATFCQHKPRMSILNTLWRLSADGAAAPAHTNSRGVSPGRDAVGGSSGAGSARTPLEGGTRKGQDSLAEAAAAPEPSVCSSPHTHRGTNTTREGQKCQLLSQITNTGLNEPPRYRLTRNMGDLWMVGQLKSPAHNSDRNLSVCLTRAFSIPGHLLTSTNVNSWEVMLPSYLWENGRRAKSNYYGTFRIIIKNKNKLN